MTKVAIFTNSLSGGGMERAMLNVAVYLQSQGASVDLLLASKKGPLLEEVPDSINLVDLKNQDNKHESIRWWLFKAAISVEPLFLFLMFVYKLPKSIKVIPKLVDYMQCNTPDVILSTPTTANLAVLWATRFSGHNKKVIVREATTLSEEINHNSSIFFRYVKRLVKKWYGCANTVVCVSDGVCNDLQENFLINKDILRVVPNIIDIQGIKKKSTSLEHNQLIENHKPYILSMGRLEKSKDFPTFIKAFHLIADKVNCNMLILGEGSERNRLVKLIEDLSLTSRVLLPGFVVNPYPYIKHCEVFALSSRWEGAPNVLREALVLNKRIICTDCSSGIRENLGNGDYGVIVPVGDYRIYSAELHKLIYEKSSEHIVDLELINKNSMTSYKKICMGSN